MPIKDKEANRKYQREWARKNGKTLKKNQVSPEKRKQMVDDAKSLPCVICEKTFPPCVMDLHHVDPATKKSGIAELQRKASYRILQEEIDKCVPLCANCHRMVHAGIKQLPDLIIMPS